MVMHHLILHRDVVPALSGMSYRACQGCRTGPINGGVAAFASGRVFDRSPHGLRACAGGTAASQGKDGLAAAGAASVLCLGGIAASELQLVK
jgi:hypothetical protein